MSPISLTYQDAGRVTPGGGASAVPAGGGSSLPLPGGFGKTRPAGMMTGLRVQARWTGTNKARVTPAGEARLAHRFASHALRSARSFEPSGRAPDLVPGSAWLKLSGGVRSLPQAPWWNAGRRARPLRARAAPQGAEVTEQRLSAFRFLFLLISS